MTASRIESVKTAVSYGRKSAARQKVGSDKHRIWGSLGDGRHGAVGCVGRSRVQPEVTYQNPVGDFYGELVSMRRWVSATPQSTARPLRVGLGRGR